MRWPESHIEFLKANFGILPVVQIAIVLPYSLKSIYSRAKSLGLKSDLGNKCRFQKGQHSNPATEFKFGHKTTHEKRLPKPRGTFPVGYKPPHTKYDGAIVDWYIQDKKYKFIRIAGKWQLYHRYLWEEANGPAPKGHVVRFINGDTLDCRLENLKLISRAEHAVLNSGNCQSDNFIAGQLSRHNLELRAELKKHPEILELKRKSNQLNKEIKNASK